MSQRDHYVSKFHLKEFTDPDSLSQQNPWLWIGTISDGRVRRKGPENWAVQPGMFRGPGGLADRNATLEEFLATDVEAPAAPVLREVGRQPPGSHCASSPALLRYLAWAAARSLPMQELIRQWGITRGSIQNETMAEPPPEGLPTAANQERDIQLVHPMHGIKVFAADSDINRLVNDGWFPDPSIRENFLEMVHIQAYYFQVRFFPRFKWFTMHAPDDDFFVISDRAVGWAADGYVDAPPSCLRDPSAYVLAPLSRKVVLIGKHTTERWSYTAARINAVTAVFAHDWIAGPTQETVEAALDARSRSV